MILTLTLCFFSMVGSVANAEPLNKTQFSADEGLTFSFENGQHKIGLGGFIQPAWRIENAEGTSTDQFWSAKRTHFYFAGNLYDDLVQFEVEMNFSDARPLMDAWVGYQVLPQARVSFGQRPSPTNNREMLQSEGFLSFSERSLLSRAFSDTGRELGLFIDGQFDFWGSSWRPQLAISSGDGRNSFGDDSRDVDRGALKWGARLDIFPLGDFSEGNRRGSPDLGHESTPKILLGAAFSYNDGTSHPRGEGHGDLVIYDTFGDPQLPDYIQMYADLLLKYQGFSVLAEFANTSATSLQGTFTDQNAANPLYSGQISEFLALGNGLNVQAGYYFEFGLSVDLRWGLLMPAFANNADSVIQETSAYEMGVSQYLLGHRLKIQSSLSRIETGETLKEWVGEIIVQMML